MTENRFRLTGGQVLLDAEEWAAIGKENDELRVKNERLRVSSTRPDAGAWVHRQAELQAEVGRLKAAVVEIGAAHLAAQAEFERLRADLAIYGDHLDSCWLKQSPRVEAVARSRCNCGYFAAVGKGLDGSNA